MIEVGPLPTGERRAAARVYADAFLDDPGWVAVGPSSARRRHAFVRRICGSELRYAERCGGFVLATHATGRPCAALVGYPPGRTPLPWWTLLVDAPGPILAGPGPGLRALAADLVLERGHPDEPHLFVSLLSVDPAHQRSGHGRALLSEALRRADAAAVPAYLDTANPANLPYYRSFGFELIGEERLPRGAPLWLMLRPAPHTERR